jgi:hypothetical protein
VIHSQAGQLAMQKDRISTLQQELEQELSLSLNRIAEQEKEIKWLPRWTPASLLRKAKSDRGTFASRQ